MMLLHAELNYVCDPSSKVGWVWVTQIRMGYQGKKWKCLQGPIPLFSYPLTLPYELSQLKIKGEATNGGEVTINREIPQTFGLHAQHVKDGSF